MGSFNIRRGPSELEIQGDSLENFLRSEERANYSAVPCEKFTDEKVATLYILPSAFIELNEQIDWKRSTRANLKEQGGILVGAVFKDINTQLICGVVHHIIPSKKSGDATYIQFTHDDWILMYKEFEEKYAPVASCEKRLIVLGWYHTHPNMPVRMSGIDKSTHVGFFPNEWQFSVIINPQNGTWAVFNGDESKNCNGYIYCTLTEGLESTETILDDNLITSEVTEQINLNQSLAPNGSFVIKRRSTIYQNSIQSSNSIDTRSIDQQSTQRYEINNNLSSRHTITVKYKGGILPYGNTFYYYPLNSDVSIGSKSYLISDALIRQFISYIDNWGFSGEESVALIYNFYDRKQFIIEVPPIRYYTFSLDNGLAVDGIIYNANSEEFIEYITSKNNKDVSLIVLYSTRQKNYQQLYEMFGSYDCLLWINPKDKYEFEFYIFDAKIKSMRSNFCVKNHYLLEENQVGQQSLEQYIQLGSDMLGELIERVTHFCDDHSNTEAYYLQTEYDENLLGKPPLRISRKLLVQFLKRITRYSKVLGLYSLVISFGSADSPSSGRNVINPWGNEFSRVWVFKHSENENIENICLKELGNQSSGISKLSKFALIISNRDVNIDTIKSKLIGHLTAVCLNIEKQSCHFYRLF